MARELGAGNRFPDILTKLAQFEVALLKFMEANLGASAYGVFADKCWPAFEAYFGFVPCYVNSRLAARGIPVACEVDIYGALSEYMCTCATELPATLLDINNTVPSDMIAAAKQTVQGDKPTDLFMGFHCGNTPAPCMMHPEMRYQLIMHRLMEPGKKPDITRGTLEGRIKTGEVTIFRLQGAADTTLGPTWHKARSSTSTPNRSRDRRHRGQEMALHHVLIESAFPIIRRSRSNTPGKSLRGGRMCVEDISFNRPAGMLYPTENPF
jgi:L-fucose isomerase-like protein